MRRGQLSASLIVAVLCFCGSALALDRDIVNSAGFEGPAFTTTFLGTGQLEGQLNPPGFGQVISPGQWLRPVGVQTGTGVVQSAVFAPGGGSQAVRIDRGANSDDRWGIPVNNQGYPEFPAANVPPGESLQPLITVSWDMRVNGPAGNPNDFGPYFGVETDDDDAGGNHLLGSFGVDATTAEVLYQAPGTGFLTPTGATVAFGAWNNYQIQLDYSTNQFSLALNKVPLGTFAFVDGPQDQFSTASIFALSASGAPADLARTGTAYFDNFIVREGAYTIPEPAAFSVMIAGLTCLQGRRRR